VVVGWESGRVLVELVKITKIVVVTNEGSVHMEGYQNRAEKDLTQIC
jgi:hypothetical protein